MKSMLSGMYFKRIWDWRERMEVEVKHMDNMSHIGNQ